MAGTNGRRLQGTERFVALYDACGGDCVENSVIVELNVNCHRG